MPVSISSTLQQLQPCAVMKMLLFTLSRMCSCNNTITVGVAQIYFNKNYHYSKQQLLAYPCVSLLHFLRALCGHILRPSAPAAPARTSSSPFDDWGRVWNCQLPVGKGLEEARDVLVSCPLSRDDALVLALWLDNTTIGCQTDLLKKELSISRQISYEKIPAYGDHVLWM